MDAKNGVNGSQEQPEAPELELPASLLGAVAELLCAQIRTNVLLESLIHQNQYLIASLMDEQDDAEPREDMEGKPIREQ